MAIYTQAQIDALAAALASGATRVSYSDKSVEYRSLAEMRELLAIMIADVNGTVRRRQIQIVSPADKGL